MSQVQVLSPRSFILSIMSLGIFTPVLLLVPYVNNIVDFDQLLHKYPCGFIVDAPCRVLSF